MDLPTLVFCLTFLCGTTLAEHVRDLEISEGAAIGTRVGFIGDGTSGDSGPPYLIVPVPGSAVDNDLIIEQNTGEIRTKVTLDRETRASYSLVAIPLSGENVRVMVRVLDENDNPPNFPQSIMNIEFPENTPRDVKRTLYPARDLDLGIYNTQRYNIVSGNVNNAFRLSSHRERDGVLYLDLEINGFLDRETTPFYNLLIEALDGGTPSLRGIMNVNITIQDVNDNQPIFNQSRYFASVPENATVGTTVLQVFATDTDAGENGQVEYFINRRQSDREGMFEIDSKTGLIIVNRPLDFETKEVHELVVVAKDHGVQPLETTAFISIRVTDVNDNQPTINVIFLSDDATPKISEGAQPGEFVARISVNDPDSKTEYSNVNVTLQGGEGHFGLATRDNIIYLVIVSLPIDREVRPNYTLSVIATDTGSPPLHASRTFHLRVTDVNDNAPEFDASVYYANVLEVADPGTSVTQITAKDKDEGDNAVLKYSILNTPDSHSNWFEIDSKTGIITTKAHIECEIDPVPQLTILVVDSGTPPLSSSATVLVTIHDVNDNEPIFGRSFYNVTIPENEEKGRCIIQVSATDPDCGVNAMVNYTIGDGLSVMKDFEIRSGTGEICIIGDLDYESNSVIELPISASDRGGLSTTAIVKIQLTDINDNRPIFYPLEYNVTLLENNNAYSSTPVVLVSATDSDSGKFGSVTYRIVSGNDNNLFRIDRNSGEISVSRPNLLSKRSKAYYGLNVTATDAAGLRATQDARVHVFIAESSSLAFGKSRYVFNIGEDSLRNSIVGSVKAAFSSGPRDTIRYSIYSGNELGYFMMDPESGIIRTASRLDHEIRSSVLLNIQAVSDDFIHAEAQVNIIIEDINDNPPEFNSKTIHVSVPENVDIGTPLYVAYAKDRDSNDNGIVLYRLSTGKNTDINHLFTIDSRSGFVKLKHQLDYETSQRHSLTIIASDTGEPSLSSNLTLVIQVQDVNDNPPIFEKNEYTINILESLPVNSQVLQVTALDHDTGNNARLTYHFKTNISNDVFGIFPNSGMIYLKKLLDRETIDKYSLIVAATDNGTPAGTATARVYITVQDSNDNDPKFYKNAYQFNVEENLPRGAVVGKLTASDGDIGNNAVIRYSFIQTNISFQINPATGEIMTREALDREMRSVYELVAEARDQGIPPRSTRVTVRVTVTDVNDNSPEIVDPHEDVISVREEQPPGTEVTRVKAIDRDEGPNATITYSILKGRESDGYGVFTVDPVTGSIKTRSILDHEERSIYRLAVAATDSGKPPRQTVRLLRVEVLDLGDNRPTFTSSSLQFKVKENVKVGHRVGTVAPTDNDINTRGNSYVTYTVTSATPRNPYDNSHTDFEDGLSVFEIDKSTGSLVVAKELDREKQSDYKIEVRALDTSSTNNPQSSAVTVKIEVIDINDNAPKWPSDTLVINVAEDTSVSTIISNVSATDSDYGSNADIRYHLVKSYPADKTFAVDSLTGIITLNSLLDFENTSEYTLVVMATDQAVNASERLSTSITVLVKVTDANDHAPVFVSPVTSTITVNDRLSPGTTILKFIAVDQDSGENGRVTYSIVNGNENSKFVLGYENGALSTDSLKQGVYVLNISATDHGTPSLSTIFTLKIKVKVINESPPRFLKPVYSVSVSEDLPPGSFVARLEAKSHNENGNKGNLSYHMTTGIYDDKFRLDTSRGTITLISTLDREATDSYTIPIYVTDNNSKQYSYYDTAILNVKVLDVNDHAPEFTQHSCYTIRVPENADFSIIHKVVANDADIGPNGDVTYTITSGNIGTRFSLDLHSGLLSGRALDRESRARYSLLVTAQDRGSPVSLQGSCNITIIVEDENDNDPKFVQQKYTATIPEDTPLDTTVLTVQATDIDVGVNAQIVYSLANESDWMFKIDNRTGAITTSGILDRETRSLYEFQVVATDGGLYDARSQKVPVKITISDVNDNKPIFSTYPFIVNVPQFTQTGNSLVKVMATDADEGSNAEIIYSFIHEQNNKFKINPNSGVVTVTSGLTSDSGRLIHLQILARDRGNPPQSATGLIEVRIDDPSDTLPSLRFQNSTYHITIPENARYGLELIQVSAVRSDGRRQRITYTLGSGNENNIFNINPETGLIQVNNEQLLDFELNNQIKVTIVASADGLLFGYCELIVSLQDENDNAPKFSQDQYTASVWEGNNKGTFVTQVSATDIDQDANSHLLYHIVDGNHDNAFIIEPPFSGLVKTNIVLDREIRDTYNLVVIATDEGSPQLTGTATLRINIVDVNDNQPTFPPHSIISVNEMTEVGTVLTEVTANDVDSNPSLTYSYLDENGLDSTTSTDSVFSIDRFSGKVTLGKKLDYEVLKEYNLKIKASDTAHTAHTALTIRVTDANDNAPVFQQWTYQATIPENSDPSFAVVTVNATDSDSGNNAVIKYSLLTPIKGITIDEVKGTVHVNRTALPPSLLRDTTNDIEFGVVATDMGRPPLKATAVVRIHVTDAKTTSTHFSQEEYQVRIREDSPRGTVILKLAPFEASGDKINIVEYVIVDGDEDGTFQIASLNGDLILLKELDREMKSSYLLKVTAADMTSSMYSYSNVTIYITIDDANDNSPRFQGVNEDGGYIVYVTECTSLGTAIFNVFANDTDLPGGPNTDITYEIISGNDKYLFNIETLTGAVILNNSLDYDNGDTEYTIIIRASDNGKAPDQRKASIVSLKIVLKDENDNSPEFPVLEYLEFVAENEPIGTVVFSAKAVDVDKGVYGRLNYTLLPSTHGYSADDWKLFKIHSNSGVVTTNSIFDYEGKNSYSMAIQATDVGGKLSKVKVRIAIEGHDEFPPQFTERTYRFVLPPPSSTGEGNLPIGFIIGSVQATDRDKGVDGRVVYQLTTQQQFFKINRTTGAIMVKKKLDGSSFETGRDISFVVTASSGRQGSLTNTTVVEIVIDPLAERGTNYISDSGAAIAATGGLADWALGLLISLILLVSIFGAVFLFLHMRNRRHKKGNKPALSSGTINTTDGFVDPGAFDTIPIRGGSSNIQGTSQFAPPKYDEIPPYGNNHTSSSGNATTSELSGSEQSGSSGRGSAEDGEDVEDEEIRMINEGPLQRDCREDDDNISDVSVHNTQEYLARLGIVDNMTGGGSTTSRRSSELAGNNKDILHQVPDSLHIFDEEGGGEADITNLIYAKLNDVSAGSDRGSNDDSVSATVMMAGFDATQQPSMTGSLSSIVHSEEELTGSYNWDYLLDWGPQYQPLAHVFSEIARLKDDTASVQSTNSGSTKSSKSKGPIPKTLPPPLLTSVAPRSIAAPVIAPRGPGHTSHHMGPHHSVSQQLLLLPRSPINHESSGVGFSTSTAMSPSFSPSLSPLATRSPSISPLVAPGHHIRQPQRITETELRI